MTNILIARVHQSLNLTQSAIPETSSNQTAQQNSIMFTTDDVDDFGEDISNGSLNYVNHTVSHASVQTKGCNQLRRLVQLFIDSVAKGRLLELVIPTGVASLEVRD